MRHSCNTRGRSAARILSPIAATLAAATFVVVAAVAPVGAAQASSSDQYPTWSDVQAAMRNEAAKQAEAQAVQAALQTAQAAAVQAAKTALAAATAADKALADLDAATARQNALAGQAAAAQAAARTAHDELGRVAAWRYRDASADTVALQLAISADPTGLLDRLGTAQQIGQLWQALSQRAVAAEGVATSLRDQATRAADARKQLADRARAASDAAKAAEQAEQAAVADASAHETTALAQLAVLRGTTAAVQKQYEIGVQVRAQEAAQAAARAAAARRQSGSYGGSYGYPSTEGVNVDPAGAQAYASGAIGGYGWGGDQYQCLLQLWTMESGWRANALNPSSGAYGIPQALPADKMSAAGPDWRTNGDTQIDWGLAYISSRYGTPCGAWGHEMSVYPHWY
jgi:hypothetical protein